MIDTLKLRINNVPFSDLEKVRLKLSERKCINNLTGEEEYNVIAGSLLGSYDNSISVKVSYNQYEYDYNENTRKYLTTIKSGYLFVEFSLHKFLLGQNVVGGTNDLQELKKFRIFLQTYFDIQVPDYNEWEVMRLDYAINFNLPYQQIYIYMKSMKNLSYSRRKVNYYGDDTIYISGATTTLKVYYKGAEFQKHDLPRLRKFLDSGKLSILAQIIDVSKDCLRSEVEFKPRFLKKHFGKVVIKHTNKRELTENLQPTVKEIDMNKIKNLYDMEIEKLMKNRNVKICKNNEVIEYLKNYEPKNWSIYYNTWVLFQTQSPKEVKLLIGKDKYYRHMKILKQHNIVIGANGDIMINKDFNLLPVDFNLYSNSKYIQNNENIAI